MGKAAEIIKFPHGQEREIGITLKQHAFNIFEQPGENLWTFDLEGRLVGMYVDGVNYRRTLANEYYEKSRITMKGEEFRTVFSISSSKAETLLERGKKQLAQVRDQLPDHFQETVERVMSTDMSTLEMDARLFAETYLPISILPPDQYQSLVLQITEGCNYNQCTFCNFYRDRPFRIKSLEEVQSHIQAAKMFFGDGLKLRRSIFLADANALVVPQKKLLPMLACIRDKFPEISKIYSFIDVFTGTKKSQSDFAELAQVGVKRVYLGIESGNPELLALLQKPQITKDIIRLGHDLKAGGISLGLIFLVGAGGEAYRSRHLRDSLNLVDDLKPGKGDIVYISEFYETNPEYRQALADQGLELPDRHIIRKLANEFKHELKRRVAPDVAVSVYDIQQFFY